MATKGEKLTELCEFLVDSFNEHDIDAFLTKYSYDSTANSVSKSIGYKDYCLGLVKALDRRGEIDTKFFGCLIQERPVKMNIIKKLRKLWLGEYGHLPAYAQKFIKETNGCKCIHGVVESFADKLEVTTPGNIWPGGNESLATWFNGAWESDSGDFKLRLVVGESRGKHRGNRDDWLKGKMVRAASSDGAMGSELLLGLLRHCPMIINKIDYKYIIDECETTPDEAADAHLLVIGTGEVNVLAAFLQALVKETIKVEGAANSLAYRTDKGPGGTSRDQGGKEGFVHPGVMLLLNNPWNLDKRLLWIAGLTGRGTANGARLVLSSGEYLAGAGGSIGVVYKDDANGKIKVDAWLPMTGDRRIWKTQ